MSHKKGPSLTLGASYCQAGLYSCTMSKILTAPMPEVFPYLFNNPLTPKGH